MMREISTEELQRYSRPALHATARMAAHWRLSPEEARQISGVPDLAARAAEKDESFVISQDQLMRTSVLLSVWGNVAWRFQDFGSAWLREPNPVYGASPLSLLVSPDFETARKVRTAFDDAETALLSGYEIPEYPVKDFLWHGPNGEKEVVFPNSITLAKEEARADGGPGRIATAEEVERVMRASEAEAAPVLDYLRSR